MSVNATERLVTKCLATSYDYLAPDSSQIRLLLEVKRGGLAHCSLPPCAVSKAVKHKTVDEIWFFLSGVGEVWRSYACQEKTEGVKSGTSITIPVGTSFQFRNTGSEPLCFIIATMPRWPGAGEAIEVEGKWKA